ncbi:hypothetical protein BGW39_005941 [Mortierella sp. 14UC]|nr:hypothetical protein BGW39_005941 [Mortierella sp. 14UC]
MHLTSALALLSVMASAVQIGNACTELCSDAPDSAKEASSLNLLGHLNLILNLKADNVSFCGSKIAECADDFGTTIDPNAIYTFSADGQLQKGEACVAPKKCTNSPTGATCECDAVTRVTGPIINPTSKKCLDARNLAVGEPVILHTCDQAVHPNWMMTADHQIRNTGTDLCLGKRLFPGQSNTGLAVEKCDPENPGLKWSIEHVGGIKDNGGSCIDVADGNYNDGVGIIVYPCHYGGNQQWTLPGDGTWSCQK